MNFQDVCVDFPIYNADSRSLKKRIIGVATGGQLSSGSGTCVVVRALDNLNFSLNHGDRVGLLGHNGAGKSTLLRLMNGVYEPSSGSMRVEGKIGSLIDISLGIDPEATGRENIVLRGCLLGLTRAEIDCRMEEIIDFSELGHFVDLPLRTYSTGMHLRLAFSISTILRPEILLMDEWLSVGDESFKLKVERRMAELVDATSILVLASHSRDLVLNVCNRVIWLDHGKIHLDGSPVEVCDAYFGN